jgi:hypothetical protein
MEYSECLPDGAAKHRPLAEKTVDPTIKPELLELAAVCEEVGDRIDDHAIQNEPRDSLISAGLTPGLPAARVLKAQPPLQAIGNAAGRCPRRGLSTGRGETHGQQN